MTRDPADYDNTTALNLTTQIAILTARIEALEHRVTTALDTIADAHGGTP